MHGPRSYCQYDTAIDQLEFYSTVSFVFELMSSDLPENSFSPESNIKDQIYNIN
jgi:hypothetical protein